MLIKSRTKIIRDMDKALFAFPSIDSPSWGINQQMDVNCDLGYLKPLIPIVANLYRISSCFSGIEGDDNFAID